MTTLIRFEPLLKAYMVMEGGDFYAFEPTQLSNLLEEVKDAKIIELVDHPSNAYAMPLKVQIQTTERCNMKCVTCAVHGGSASAQLPTSQIFQILDKLSDVGVLNIQWSGGEPFSRVDFFELVAYAAEKGFQQNVYTNATMLTEKSASFLKKNFFKTQISLDGTEEIFEAIVGVKLWNKFDRGLNMIISKGTPNVTLATVLQDKNVMHMERIIRYAGRSGADKLRISMLVPIGRSRDISWEKYSVVIEQFRSNWPRLKNIADDHGLVVDCFLEKEACLDDEISDIGQIVSPGGHSFLYINASGIMFPFPFLTGPELSLGSILTSDLRQVWFKSEALQNLRKQTYKNTGCGSCRLECSFAERSIVYAFTGQINGSALAHAECQKERR